MTSDPFPWDEAMAFGLGVLRLSPREFWMATPRELAAAAMGIFGPRRAVGPPGLAAIEELMRAFPDRETTNSQPGFPGKEVSHAG